MRSRVLLGSYAAVLVFFGLAVAVPSQAGHDDVVLRCESIGQETHSCAADTRNGVRLGRQLSDGECVENRSWGSTPDGVWVKDGCRAEFVIGYGSSRRGGYGAQVVRCDSKGNRWNHCDLDTESGVEIVRQRSDQACIMGQSWGWDEGGVWVSGGCQGDFRAKRPRGQAGPGVAGARVVRCESRAGRSSHCALRGDDDVRLRRQLSRIKCVRNRTWGVDDEGIWVTRGCRADFELLARERD